MREKCLTKVEAKIKFPKVGMSVVHSWNKIYCAGGRIKAGVFKDQFFTVDYAGSVSHLPRAKNSH